MSEEKLRMIARKLRHLSDEIECIRENQSAGDHVHVWIEDNSS